jgi:hypothetical protein
MAVISSDAPQASGYKSRRLFGTREDPVIRDSKFVVRDN